MKNFFTPFALFLLVTSLSAQQLQKGSILLGGSVGINNTSIEGSSFTLFNASPMAGFFLSDNFALGGKINFLLLASEGESSSSLALGPAARYYFTQSGKNCFFGQVDTGIQIEELGGDGDPLFQFGIGIGADFFLNDHVAIEGIIGYGRTQNFEAEAGLNNIGLNFGIAAFIGGGKKE